jgi:coatomer subunit beta
MSSADKNCTFLISTEKSTQATQDDVIKLLESTEIPNKIDGLKKAITSMLAGEAMPRALMTVIRYVKYRT